MRSPLKAIEVGPRARSELRLICYDDGGVAGHAGVVLRRFIRFGEVDGSKSDCMRCVRMLRGAASCWSNIPAAAGTADFCRSFGFRAARQALQKAR
ncbi:hypothetical protein [Bradyrhizobium centrolobii]|uniref:hypothetical protein n=1 Tax=Bradyrhizobium centrolobii TaxID=1505087 RepID=UPI0009EDA48F